LKYQYSKVIDDVTGMAGGFAWALWKIGRKLADSYGWTERTPFLEEQNIILFVVQCL
jgi:hypothetical protein